MLRRNCWVQTAREWLASLLCFSILLAPVVGCTGSGVNLDDLDDLLGNDEPGLTSRGLFISETDGGPLIGARAENGDSIFVFGTRNASGGLGEVESIVFRSADGKQAYVTFESGRPVHAQGPNGSYAHITYKEVTPTALRGSIELFNADDQSRQSFDAEVDLTKSLQQVAQSVKSATGIDITPLTVLNDTEIETGKTMQRAGVKITILPLFAQFVIPLVAVVAFFSLVGGQFTTVLVAIAAVALHVVILGIFAPLLSIGNVLGNSVINVRLLPFSQVFGSVPDEPGFAMLAPRRRSAAYA